MRDRNSYAAALLRAARGCLVPSDDDCMDQVVGRRPAKSFNAEYTENDLQEPCVLVVVYAVEKLSMSAQVLSCSKKEFSRCLYRDVCHA